MTIVVRVNPTSGYGIKHLLRLLEQAVRTFDPLGTVDVEDRE